MEDGIRISEDAGIYRPLADEYTNASDDSRLKQLGYRQELSRSPSTIANFAVTFTIISVLTGLTTTFSTVLTYGSPLTMVYRWPIVGMFTMVVGLAMAEICSAYPMFGGLYFWSAKLCGNEWEPFASWLTGCKLRCCICGHISDTFERLIDLSLEIEDVDALPCALESFTKVEKIEDLEMKSTCDKLKEDNVSSLEAEASLWSLQGP